MLRKRAIPQYCQSVLTFTLLLVAGVLGGCGGVPFRPHDDVNASLPALPAGPHLGTWVTYENLPTGVKAVVTKHLEGARAAGMRMSRVHVAWSDIEPSKGVFDLDPLTEALANVPEDDAVLALIETIDSDGFSLPADLVGEDGGYDLAVGRRFGDATINQRFADMIERAAPLLARRKVFAVSVGNEPDNYFDDVDPTSSEGVAWQEDMVAFLTAARKAVRSTLPDVAVGMTLTQGSVEKGRGEALKRILAAGDVALFNYYGQDLEFKVQPASVVVGEIDQLVALSGSLPIVFQEVGCPAGATPSRISGSETAQSEFLAAVGRELTVRPQLRAAFWFQMVDWSPELAATFGDALVAEGHHELGARVKETLTTMGLVRHTDGSVRSSWSVFVDTIRDLRR